MVNTVKAITCKKCGLPKDLCTCKELEEEFDAWERASIADWIASEEEEDNIRKSKRKSIHYGGKYKGRHHGSKQKEC